MSKRAGDLDTSVEVSGESTKSRLRQVLAESGLGLVTVLRMGDLPPSLAEAICIRASDIGGDRCRDELRVVVIGNHGGEFSRFMVDDWRSNLDPVDDFSVDAVKRAIALVGLGSNSTLVYPGHCGFSLQQLGELCGWGYPSWLGISIHPRYGTWFAFRAVFLTTQRLPPDITAPLENACAACVSRDCRMACPVDAPGTGGRFKLAACVEYRLEANSPCASRCLARERCPAGPEHRYPRDLVEHFYLQSLASLREGTAHQI